MKSNWDILGIDATTDKRVIKRAYAKMLAKYHPEEFPEKFEEINHAYKWALLHCDICCESSTIKSLPEPDISLEHTSETASEAEQHISSDNDLDINTFDTVPSFLFYPRLHNESVFASDTVSEMITEQNKQAAEAVEAFRLKICAAECSILYDYKGQQVLQSYVESESFKAVKNNPAFIEGLGKLFTSGCILTPQIRILRKAFGIEKKWNADRYPSDLAAALIRLDEILKKREYRYNPISTAILLAFCATIIIVLVLTVSFVVNRVRSSYSNTLLDKAAYAEHCVRTDICSEI